MNEISIAIDRGGTFTDVVAFIPGKENYIFKLLSVDPTNYEDANIEGIRRVIEYATGQSIPRNKPLDTSHIKSLKLGTTVATNALLERKGERCVFLTTKGFKDSLVIGDQTRPDIFELNIIKPELIYDSVVEVDERVTLQDYFEDPEQNFTIANGDDLIKGITGETIKILKSIDIEEVKTKLKSIYDSGIKSIAICFLHSYTYPQHELIVGEIAKKIGFNHISLSHELSPMIKYIPRANSSVADAYLTPEIGKYLNSFKKGLKDGIQSLSENKFSGIKCQFMKSDGGLIESSKFSGLKAILSGPAGGVVGLAKTCYDETTKIPLIGLDVGGTSTDCCRFSGKFDHILETFTAGVTIQSPQLDINTIAAGGGSRLFFENGLMRVGPESAGAQPGPLCYKKKGGHLTITDANLVLNRLLPEFFPKIFGPKENESLDKELTLKEFKRLADKINLETNKSLTIEQVAEGFLNIANESMARPIRTLTESKGHLLSDHRLVSFGGGGGQCCCFVAFDTLGINTVLVHKYSSVLSAYGMALADVVDESQEPSSMTLNLQNEENINDIFDKLCKKSSNNLRIQGINEENITFEKYLNTKYKGTESSIMISITSNNVENHIESFIDQHLNEFGFKFDDKEILIDDFRVRAIGKTYRSPPVNIDKEIRDLTENNKLINQNNFKPIMTKPVYFDGKYEETPIFKLKDLKIGSKLQGPVILVDGTQTNVIPPNGSLIVLKSHLFIEKIDKESQKFQDDSTSIDPILLSIFGHRFIDIAEQMGYSLQKTAVSTNVKERLDFSCALFDSNSNLIASAPHIPVHLGSMSTFVKFQSKLWKNKLKPGDVLVGNHPICGTHLPDITVMTPVFNKGEVVFYLASRAHHSDIGSILPGSMPPNSKELWQEGAIIYSELLVKQGKFQEDKMIELLLVEPTKYPGCSGTRKLSDNLSDLKAQVAANQKGLNLLMRLIDQYGFQTVNKYMDAIQVNAGLTVENLLEKFAKNNNGKKIFKSFDFMDDGSKINLTISIEENLKKATLDFTGTTQEIYSNLNAPKAITYSAIIYCLRCLVNEDIPLNEGFLRPLNIIIPNGSFLSPSEGAAVVAGNVLTSQRITDVIFKAFGIMADSQGCTNNFTFGIGGKEINKNEHVNGFGYYETIAGGSGAGNFWDGTDGVHTNMTNTKMTDVEVFEKRYPVILHEFSIREYSGGKGKFVGGNGIKRDIEFKIPLKASILSERRVNPPNGINGGENGERGLNLWKRQNFNSDGSIKDITTINIGGKNTVEVNKGDHIILCTPGGGGYGDYKLRNEVVGKEFSQGFKHVGTGSVYQRKSTQNTN